MILNSVKSHSILTTTPPLSVVIGFPLCLSYDSAENTLSYDPTKVFIQWCMLWQRKGQHQQELGSHVGFSRSAAQLQREQKQSYLPAAGSGPPWHWHLVSFCPLLGRSQCVWLIKPNVMEMQNSTMNQGTFLLHTYTMSLVTVAVHKWILKKKAGSRWEVIFSCKNEREEF